MKNKIVWVFIAILCFLGGLFLIYKASCYSIYKSLLTDIDNIDDIIEGYRVNDSVNVESKQVESYIKFDGYMIGNYFKDFQYDEEMSGEDNSIYYQYKNGKKTGMLSIGTSHQIVDAVKEEDFMLMAGEEKEGLDFTFLLYDGINNFIKSNNIKNDAQLMKAFINYDYDQELGVFSPFSKFQEDFSVRLVVSIVLPAIDNIYFLEGDLEGYMLEKEYEDSNRSMYEINIIKNNKRYIFSILSVDFDLDDVREIINSIYIG